MSREFYTERNGKKQDDTLHRPMLNNPEAEKKAQQKSAALARAYGMSNEMIQLLYPLAN